jgi:hypothetical protein
MWSRSLSIVMTIAKPGEKGVHVRADALHITGTACRVPEEEVWRAQESLRKRRHRVTGH